MLKIKKILSIICILISIHTFVYASVYLYDAEEYIIKIKNINENIERSDLISFEECDIEETGLTSSTTVEIVPLFGEDEPKHLENYDTEKYYIKPIIRYNYVYGKAAQDIEHTILSGIHSENKGKNLITYDYATEKRFNNYSEFHRSCPAAKTHEFICVKTTSYNTYRITPIKEISISNIKLNQLVYKHDDLSNLDIGIRIKNKAGEYKTFISNENNMGMRRAGGPPLIKDKEKIIIFDYHSGTYKSNSNHSFYAPSNNQLINILTITIILLVIIMSLIFFNIILKKKKTKKNNL